MGLSVVTGGKGSKGSFTHYLKGATEGGKPEKNYSGDERDTLNVSKGGGGTSKPGGRKGGAFPEDGKEGYSIISLNGGRKGSQVSGVRIHTKGGVG